MYLPGHFEPGPSSAGPSYPNNANSARRPWSPIHYDEDIANTPGFHDYYAQDHVPGSVLRAEQRGRRQQASEDSVEALDLADYARTLRRPAADRHNPYPPFPHTSHVHPLSVPTPVYANSPRVSPHPFDSYPEYPPTPDSDRPFSALSRDTFNQAPPSLVSGDTSHDSHDSYGSPQRYPSRRPYSLPPFFAATSAEHLPNRGPAIFSATSGSPHHSLVHIPSPVLDEHQEGDISRFPAFSRGWYDDPFKTAKSEHSSLPPYASDLNYDHRGSYQGFPSSASSQSRNLLPWSSQLSDANGPAVDGAVKEERMRMLEREFGGKGKAGKEGDGALVIGSVDENGALITSGPRKRVGARWAQGVLALGAAFSSLYGALFVKPKTPAPPASTPPAFALYVLSVVTFFLVFYLFAIRPCCCGKRSKSSGRAGPTAGGMMVLPVQGLPGGKKKKNKKGKKDKHGNGGGGDVHVNLIVDPGMFGGGRRGQDEEYGEEDDYGDMDGSQVSSRRRAGRGQGQGQGQQRRSIFQGLTMENDWKAARKLLRRMLFLDIACMVVWAGVFILILFGKKCPPGGFSGWCDSYNIASAAACILCVAFGFSVFFNIMDLHKSKASPRTRT